MYLHRVNKFSLTHMVFHSLNYEMHNNSFKKEVQSLSCLTRGYSHTYFKQLRFLNLRLIFQARHHNQNLLNALHQYKSHSILLQSNFLMQLPKTIIKSPLGIGSVLSVVMSLLYCLQFLTAVRKLYYVTSVSLGLYFNL